MIIRLLKGIFGFLFRWWMFTVPVIAGLIALAVWLFFFVFAFHLSIFNIDDKVNEDVFVFSSGAQVDMTEPEAETPEPQTEAPLEPPTGSPSNTPNPQTETAAPAATTTTMDPRIRQSVPAEFMRRSHPATGTAFLITDGEQVVLRIEDLRTDNGPDLDVYLVPLPGDAPARQYDDDFVNLGDLKGNIGDQFYEIPPGTDLNRYTTAVIWCVRFDVAFGTVELNPLPPA